MASPSVAYERGLPANLDAERFVLGSILLEPMAFIGVAGLLESADFSLEANRRIFERMGELYERGDKIDRVTLADELIKKNQLESVGGLTYLISLDDGLPQIFNLDSYVKIVKDKSLLRKIILSAQKVMDHAFLAEDEPSAILSEAEEGLLKLSEGRNRFSLQKPGQIIDEFEGGLNSFLDPTKRRHGISTGFLKLDEMTGGFREGELIILAARPAMGKTALALNMGTYIATHPKNPQTVAVFSLEMSKEQLLTRMICSEARVDQQRFRSGYLDGDERRRLMTAANTLADAPLFIDDSAAANVMDIHAKLRRLKAEHGLSMVIVDYLQLMQTRGRAENRVQEVSQLSRGLKLLSKELRIPVVVLSQLSRATEQRVGDHRPQLSDLRESGSIEQDADIVLFCFREEYYKRDVESLRGQAELIIGKQRNGPTGTVNLFFRHEFTRFENRTGDVEAAGYDGGDSGPIDLGDPF
ncbi:MAG: replicative DNA helicase [Bryobacteraceae bacterium]|nr:replicative DNA helicase [Bryobacteraceae bacterium]